jgi:hypothetical protein
LQVSYSKVEVELEVEVKENEAKRETITVTEMHQEAKRCKEENHKIKPPLGGFGGKKKKRIKIVHFNQNKIYENKINPFTCIADNYHCWQFKYCNGTDQNTKR